MTRVSGASLMTFQVFMERQHGEQAFEEVLSRMTPADAEPLRGIVLPVNWYPTTSFIRAIEMAHSMFGSNDLYERYGKFAAEFQITTFQRLLLRFTSPAYMLNRAGKVWRRFHETGEWDTKSGNKTMRGELRNFAVVSSGYCRVVRSWILRAGLMTGVADGGVDHPQCRARGADFCVFTGWWK